MYLCKSVDIIIFLLRLKFYQNFKNYHAGKLNKTDLVNICFAKVFNFALTSKLDDTFTFIWKKILRHIFCVSMKYLTVWILWPGIRIYLQGVWFSGKLENVLRL